MIGKFGTLLSIILLPLSAGQAAGKEIFSERTPIVVAQNTSKTVRDRQPRKGPVCSSQRGLWGTGDNKTRVIVYGANGVQSLLPSDIYLEEWRDGKLAWRAKGQVECSNGASVCRATFPNAITSEHPLQKEDGSTGTSSGIVEVVDENDDGLPEYVVFAGLAQDVYYHKGLKANWFNGFSPNEASPFALPKNVLKFIGCRATNTVELMDAPLTDLSEPKKAPVGRVFAWKEVCEHYNKTGELRGTSDIPGTWYMDDKELSGYESYCLIANKTATNLSLLCEGMGEDVFKNETTYKQKGNEILLAGEEDTPLIACDSLR